MAEIERYDPVMGTRLYLCITDDGRQEWTDRFYSSELPDVQAERLASEITHRLKNAGFVVEVLY
jgi:hypothetical protein